MLVALACKRTCATGWTYSIDRCAQPSSFYVVRVVACLPAGQPVEGHFETESQYVDGRTVRRVVLRHYGSAPGTGLVHALYRAAILAVDHDAIWLLGIEEAEGAAVV
jgi:hypothetical protein